MATETANDSPPEGKAAKGKKSGRKKVVAADQPPLPGMEQMPKIPKVHNRALNYKQICIERAALSKDEKEAHDALKIAMQEAGISYYEHGNVKVDLQTGDAKCKVELQDVAPPAKAPKKKGSKKPKGDDQPPAE